jgi:hypothetical protein
MSESPSFGKRPDLTDLDRLTSALIDGAERFEDALRRAERAVRDRIREPREVTA